jgi:tripartite-type tricarboxylate transporter receptor subunit TctC
MRTRIGFVVCAMLAASSLCQAQNAPAAGDYPNRPVRLIIPFPPGGPADLIARVMGQKFSEEFGKQFYIENHAGAGGNLGTGVAARAPADGYSLLINSQSMMTNRSLYKSVPYDPDKDFAPVTRIATTPNLLIVHPSVPAKTVKELVDLLRNNSDKYHGYAHPGLGTPSNLSGELFRMSQNLTLTSIPFGGGGPMVQSVLAGHTPIGFTSLAPAAAHIRAGTLRALAVLADKRLENLPDVPTMAEAGYPNQTGETPQGILVPAGTPKEIIDLLRAKVLQLIALPDVKQRLAAIGFSPIGDTPAEFAAFLKSEDERWGKVIRDANLKLQ